MEAYHGKDIRNISLVGHSGCGKTSLIEAILKLNGYIDSKGSIDMGNTVSDFTKEEIERRISINSTLMKFLIQEMTLLCVCTVKL